MDVESPPEDLKGILGPNEQVQMYLKQKIYHPKLSIDSIVVTNERIILRHPHALGLKKDYTDYNYRDISNVLLDRGVLRSNLKFTLRQGGEPLTLDAIPNAEAQQAYGLVRENLVKFQTPTVAPFGVSPTNQTGPLRPTERHCDKCGASLAEGQKFCGTCGAEASPPTQTIVEKEVVRVKCTYCGYLNDETASACKSCGAKL